MNDMTAKPATFPALELARLACGAEAAFLLPGAPQVAAFVAGDLVAPEPSLAATLRGAAEAVAPGGIRSLPVVGGWSGFVDARGTLRPVLALRHLAGRREDTARAAEAVFDAAAERADLAVTRARLRRADAMLASVERMARIGVWQVDLASGRASWSAETFRIHGLPSGTPAPDLDGAVDFYPEEVRGHARTSILDAIQRRAGFSFTLPFRRADDRLRTVRCFGQVASGEDGDHLFGILQDVTEEKEAELRLWQTANHDALTGLPNRFLFQDRLAAALEKATADGGSGVGLILADIDDFKAINDVYGHEAGDEALKRIAAQLLANTRQGDTVARLGGDEFAVVVTGIGGADDIERPLARLAAAAETSFDYRGTTIRLRLSFGAAAYPRDARDGRELYRNADLALFRTKREPARRGTRYHPSYGEEQQGREERLRRIREAVAAGAVTPYYQPVVDLRTGAVAAVELLARWRDGEDLMNATALAPAFDDPELSPLVGVAILEQLSRDWTRFTAESGRVVPISVNASARELQNPRYLQTLGRILDTVLPDGGDITLEVDANPFAGGGRHAQAALSELMARGLGFGFGNLAAGFAALMEPRALSVRQIKVPGAKLLDPGALERAGPILAGMIETCRAAGVKLVATEIETADDLVRLKSLGYTLGQGFLFAKAMSFPDLMARIERDRPRPRRAAAAAI
jgi:diguanylate cyclase (GGDEF)-like protein